MEEVVWVWDAYFQRISNCEIMEFTCWHSTSSFLKRSDYSQWNEMKTRDFGGSRAIFFSLISVARKIHLGSFKHISDKHSNFQHIRVKLWCRYLSSLVKSSPVHWGIACCAACCIFVSQIIITFDTEQWTHVPRSDDSKMASQYFECLLYIYMCICICIKMFRKEIINNT